MHKCLGPEKVCNRKEDVLLYWMKMWVWYPQWVKLYIHPLPCSIDTSVVHRICPSNCFLAFLFSGMSRDSQKQVRLLLKLPLTHISTLNHTSSPKTFQRNEIQRWLETNKFNQRMGKKTAFYTFFPFPLCLFVASGGLAPMPYEGKTNRKKLNVEHVICYKKKTVKNWFSFSWHFICGDKVSYVVICSAWQEHTATKELSQSHQKEISKIQCFFMCFSSDKRQTYYPLYVWLLCHNSVT